MAKLEDIYNFAQVSDQLGTAGQPKRDQFSAIKDAGYEVVINLADGTTEQDIPEEDEIVDALGLTYHHLPVDWENPTSEKLAEFFSLMASHHDQKVFVHCIANYRVSGFVLLYRVIKQSVPLADARAFKDTVWNPEHQFPIWDDFIQATLKEHGIEDTSA